MEYFVANPKRGIKHPEIVDWATKEWQRRTGKVFRDPDRAIRKLAQGGKLIKVAKGIYRYDPGFVKQRNLEDFTAAQKAEIMRRDHYKCVECGRGKKDGVEIMVDHIKPKDLGGESAVENGETLCAQHNFIKKNYSQREAGKRFFAKMYETALRINDKEMIDFCNSIFDVYDKFNMDKQIRRPRNLEDF